MHNNEAMKELKKITSKGIGDKIGILARTVNGRKFVPRWSTKHRKLLES